MRHVTLPGWADCYDWAMRLEYLGVGLWGSREGCPDWTAEELGAAIERVVLGPDAATMQAKADELSRVCKARESGRDIAAKALLSEMQC